eukprot:gene4404-4993_t
MARLTDKEFMQVIDTINLLDKKGDGRLAVQRIADCLRSLGLNPLELEVGKIANEIIEYHHEKRISADDFLPIYEQFLTKRKPTQQELCDGLKALDPYPSVPGTLDATELRMAMTTTGEKLTDTECSFILDQVTNARNRVDIKQLIRLVTGEGKEVDTADDYDDYEEGFPISVPTSSRVFTAEIKTQEDHNQAVKKIFNQTEQQENI